MVVSTALLAAVLAQQAPVLRSGTTVVQVTIVARDHRGAFAGGLTADDFTITENAQRVTPLSCREVSSPGATAAARPAAAGAFSNSSGRTPGSVTVVVLDRLNTKWEDQGRARDQLHRFFSQVRADDRIAVYAIDGTALRVLHDFTSDASALIAAIDPAARPTSAHIAAASDPGTSPGVFELMSGIAADTTVAALETIGQHLAAISGRKNVVWVSPGFDINGPLHNFDRDEAMRRAARALTTADIALYSIDPSGVPAVFSSVTATTTTFASGIAPNHDILEGLSEQTGGRAFLNTNDIAMSVRAALDDAARHYELQYASPLPISDSRYREIKVTVRKPDIDLRYRRGYYATAAHAPNGDRKTAIGRALGNPLAATGIGLSVTPRNTAAAGGVELSVHADGAALLFAQGKGTWSGSVDLAIAQVRPDGTTSVDVDTTIALHLTDAQHDAIIEDGVSLTKTVVLATGTARLAVVVRDGVSGAIGSVVIPAAALRQAR